MITITREEMAQALGLQLEEVAIRRAGSYSRHIAIKGTSYCGRLDNDGYNIDTEYESLSAGVCGTCLKRYNTKAGK